MKTNQKGIELLKEFEGFRANSYLCPANVWTIGYGHTSAAGEPKVYSGQKITKKQAEEILKQDLEKFEFVVESSVQVPLTENQFSALVSFVYNIGSSAFKSSTLLRKLNAKDYLGAADEFKRWNKGGGRVLQGLVRRREAERELFLENIALPKSASPKLDVYVIATHNTLLKSQPVQSSTLKPNQYQSFQKNTALSAQFITGKVEIEANHYRLKVGNQIYFVYKEHVVLTTLL
jgi:lysozyme